MIPLVGNGIRQISACFGRALWNCFSVREVHGISALEALPSITRSVSNCQNRYPSPSGWSGPNPRVRSSYTFGFERPAADNMTLTQITLVGPHLCNVFVGLGRSALQIRGKLTCTRNFLSYLPRRSWDWRGVIAEAISSARSSVVRSDAPQVKSTKMESASPVRLSAQPPVLWQTTSDHAQLSLQRDSTGLSRHFAEQPFSLQCPDNPGTGGDNV